VLAPLALGLFLLLVYAGLLRATLRLVGASREPGPATASAALAEKIPAARDSRGSTERVDQAIAATGGPAAQFLLVGTAAALLAFILAFRALPAHYLLDVLPLAVVIQLPRPHWQTAWLGGLLVVSVCGQALIIAWQALVALAPGAVLLLTMRNIAWVLAFSVLLVALWRWSDQSARPARASARGML
jgi:hypothetical protein